MVKRILIGLIFGVLSTQVGQLGAETLSLRGIEKNALVKQPVRGALMKQVENQFGQPLRKKSAVGKPPITRWVYAEFTVFFEYNHVIHSVLKPVYKR